MTHYTSGSAVNVLKILGGVVDFAAKDTQKFPNFEVVVPPRPAAPEVPGADNAAYTLATYTSSTPGKTRVAIYLAANRNETVYVFEVLISNDYFNENQDLVWQIVNSLQLTP